MTNRVAGLAAALAAMAVLWVGCAAPSAPAWHSLVPAAAMPAAGASAPGVPAPASIAIGRVGVPEEVDRAPLVMLAPGGLKLLDGERWIEPLKAQLPRAIALGIGQQRPGVLATAYPGSAAGARWRLSADVQRFELRTQPAEARLRVAWTLRGAADGAPPAMQLFETAVPAEGALPQALVAAMSRAVARFSAEVAQQVCAADGC